MKTINPFMGLALCGIAAQAQEKPNFLIIQCDHLTTRRWRLRSYTRLHPSYRRSSFKRSYLFQCLCRLPLSQPSRAALWSGMMPHQTNVRSNSSEPITPIPENVPTLGKPFFGKRLRSCTLRKNARYGFIKRIQT